MTADSSAPAGPVFVIGSYRSGTSILAWCLSQHPNLFHLPETYWIAKLSIDLDYAFSIGSRNGRFSHLGQLGLSKDEFYRHMGAGIDAFIRSTRDIMIEKVEGGNRNRTEMRRKRSASDPKHRWVDATPENTHYVPGLLRLFPDARFIHILRDPHQVARSLENFTKAGGPRDYETKEAYEAWLRLTRAAVRAERALGRARVHRLAYGELVGNGEAALRSCLGFLGEPYCADCLRPLSSRINSSKVEELAPLEPVAGTTLPGWVQEADALYDEIRREPVPPEVPVESDLNAMIAAFEDLIAAGRTGERAASVHTRTLNLYRKLRLALGIDKPDAVT